MKGTRTHQNDWPSFLEYGLSSKRFELRGYTLHDGAFPDTDADGDTPPPLLGGIIESRDTVGRR